MLIFEISKIVYICVVVFLFTSSPFVRGFSHIRYILKSLSLFVINVNLFLGVIKNIEGHLLSVKLNLNIRIKNI